MTYCKFFIILGLKGFKVNEGFRIAQQAEQWNHPPQDEGSNPSPETNKFKKEMEDIMNRLSRQIIVALLAIFGFLYLMGVAGSYDYADEVVYTMDDEVYYSITQKIGKTSNKEVVAEYEKNREYYDSLKY